MYGLVGNLKKRRRDPKFGYVGCRLEKHSDGVACFLVLEKPDAAARQRVHFVRDSPFGGGRRYTSTTTPVVPLCKISAFNQEVIATLVKSFEVAPYPVERALPLCSRVYLLPLRTGTYVVCSPLAGTWLDSLEVEVRARVQKALLTLPEGMGVPEYFQILSDSFFKRPGIVLSSYGRRENLPMGIFDSVDWVTAGAKICVYN